MCYNYLSQDQIDIPDKSFEKGRNYDLRRFSI
jgi:hypothetical protein